RDYARVGDFAQRALDIARDAGDPIRLAHTLSRLDNWYTNVERPREALQCHREALAIFEGLQDRRGLAETLDFLGMAATLAANPCRSLCRCGWMARRYARLARRVDHAHADGDHTSGRGRWVQKRQPAPQPRWHPSPRVGHRHGPAIGGDEGVSGPLVHSQEAGIHADGYD